MCVLVCFHTNFSFNNDQNPCEHLVYIFVFFHLTIFKCLQFVYLLAICTWIPIPYVMMMLEEKFVQFSKIWEDLKVAKLKFSSWPNNRKVFLFFWMPRWMQTLDKIFLLCKIRSTRDNLKSEITCLCCVGSTLHWNGDESLPYKVQEVFEALVANCR